MRHGLPGGSLMKGRGRVLYFMFDMMAGAPTSGIIQMNDDNILLLEMFSPDFTGPDSSQSSAGSCCEPVKR